MPPKVTLLKHTGAGPPFSKLNLSKLLYVLPKLHELTSLFVHGWVPFSFTSPGAGPPRSLKKITMLQVAYCRMEKCDTKALLWLLNPDITNSSGLTALAFDINDALTRSCFPYDKGHLLYSIARDALKIVKSLRFYRCFADDPFEVSMVLKHCKALETLSVILPNWQPYSIE